MSRSNLMMDRQRWSCLERQGTENTRQCENLGCHELIWRGCELALMAVEWSGAAGVGCTVRLRALAIAVLADVD
jgi:hypothetical protein